MNVYVLMGDIIKSQTHIPVKLMEEFKLLIDTINNDYKNEILSPLTITLGDEFQGIVTSVKSSVQVIMAIEELMIERKLDFKLRYVLHQGEVETEINKDQAFGMLGTGLTEAREKLNSIKKLSGRFHFSIEDDQDNKLNQLFILFQYFIDRWSIKDCEEVTHFLSGKNYKKVAKLVGKDESTLWRKRRSLAIDEYQTCKVLIYEAA